MIEIKEPSDFGGPVPTFQCQQWVASFGLTHELLRDDGSAASELGLGRSNILVLDRQLKIVYRNPDASSPAAQSAVLSHLAQQTALNP